MLTEIYFDNFKSLKNVLIRPKVISFFCGPNASGKSNLAQALDFLSHTFRDGLSYAVAEKGGFYNMCFRKMKRARGAISCRVKGQTKIKGGQDVEFEVSFGIRAKGQEIRAEFEVAREAYSVRFITQDKSDFSYSLQISRHPDHYEAAVTSSGKPPRDIFLRSPESAKRLFKDIIKPQPGTLLFPSAFPGIFPLGRVVRDIASLRVFQINPRIAQQAGTPSLSGDLGRNGENLASAVDYFSIQHKPIFEKLQVWMRDVVPGAGNLETKYTEGKKIGLFLAEKGFRRSWYADELSDGTVMSIGLFLALLDPRYPTIMIEEPENSLHPWMLHKFLEHAREASGGKQILLTTHSPLVVAASQPEELFLLERRNGATQVISALEQEPMLPQIIQKKLMSLGDYWLSGGMGAVPEVADLGDEDILEK